MANKPLGIKAYGSIPHLPGSRLGAGDHHCEPGQATICTIKLRDKHDLIIVTEKLDGSCCAVAKVDGVILALGRAGYLAQSSKYEQHQLFADWVRRNEQRFAALLQDGERVVGEWLAQAHGTRYALQHEPFVVFDLMRGAERANSEEFAYRVVPYCITPHILHLNGPCSIEHALDLLGEHGFHGAIDQPEGAVWRVERNGKVDYLAKFVRPDKIDGKYLPEITGGESVWNWQPTPSIDEIKGIVP